MASGSASYSTSAVNYGRNSADAYYYLSAPDTIQGPLTVTGNLVVDGSSTLTGPVTAGALSAPSVTTGALVGTGAGTKSMSVDVTGGTLSVNGAETVSGALAVGGALNVTGAATVTGAAILNGGATVTGAATFNGGASLPGTNQLNLGTGSYLVNQGTNILANVGGIAALSVEAARVSSLVPLSVGSLVAGSLGATAPVVPTLFGTSGVSGAWKNTGGGVDQATFVIAGYRVIFGTSGFAGNNAATTVNFTTPFAATCMPLVFLQSMTAGSGPPVSGLAAICQTGGGTGASPTYTGFQAQGVQAGGSSFPASFCWLAIGAA